MQIHNDIVAYNDGIENHIDFDDNHEKEHHKNDTEDEKNREHHHHCSSVNLVNVFIPIKNQLNFRTFSQEKKEIIYYKFSIYSSYLDTVFQPPKNS